MAPLIAQKKIKKRPATVTYIEPKRKNLLDVIYENMALANRSIFLHRLIYIGRHSFGLGEFSNAGFYFKETIDEVNRHHCDEFLTGYFLNYSKYFCHVVEGSEITLKKHLKLVFTTPDITSNIEKPKLLVAYHHINQRFLDFWTTMSARPPTLLEKIDITTDLQNTTAKVAHCVQKLYKLGISLRPKSTEIEESSSSESSSVVEEYIKVPAKSTISNFEDIGRPIDSLPEYSLLDFLIESQYVTDLKVYVDSFGSVPVLKKYEDLCWPAPADYVPRNVFDSEHDPVVDLPIKIQEEDPDLI